ncbi:MAG: DUF1499 domain-containing protein [Acetobacteraceae bacterium]|nr:DUF1499 domain-containing protein [Acetobacteraceae bacterium]
MLTPLALLASLFLPACGATGAHGVPSTPVGFNHLVRPSKPNTALAAPAGYSPKPDIVTPVYPVSPTELSAIVQRVAGAQPATFKLGEDESALEQGWVARSLIFNFPDVIWAHIRPAETGNSELLLYSRSIYGHSDFGVNRHRVDTWLAAVATAVTAVARK